MDWHKGVASIDTGDQAINSIIATSAAVLRTHEEKGAPGGIVASLSIPWGNSKGDDDLGGYHLVWPRDLVEAAGGLLALGLRDDAVRVIAYLHTTQNADGSWPQNMWLDGTPYWDGMQIDETAFPILLVELALREGAIDLDQESHLINMVRLAAGYIVRNGPVTQEDRWEEDAGYSPFTLAVEVAALRAAAGLAERIGQPEVSRYLQETAAAWDAAIERWTYVEHTDLARRLGVDGYYVRIAPPDVAEAGSPNLGWVPIKNRPPQDAQMQAANILSPDALALVRFGLRAPDDPRIVNTVKAVDATLLTQTACGPVWHRYTGDGYGEHEDGRPFDGTGIGRGWPLFAGERGHYELAAGRPEHARALLHTMARQAGDGGMLPEQVWDSDDLPELGLRSGRPAGSAMPLVWAHAEFVKLARSLRDGAVFDRPSNQSHDSTASRLSNLALQPPAALDTRRQHAAHRRACRRLAPLERRQLAHRLRRSSYAIRSRHLVCGPSRIWARRDGRLYLFLARRGALGGRQLHGQRRGGSLSNGYPGCVGARSTCPPNSCRIADSSLSA